MTALEEMKGVNNDSFRENVRDVMTALEAMKEGILALV